MALTKIMFAHGGAFALGDTVAEATAAWVAANGPAPTAGYFLARVEPTAYIDGQGNIQPPNYEPMPHL